MLKNYLKIAWRNLLNNKTSSFINISGLSIGMAIAMLIGCWIYSEWSADRQFENYQSIAQVWELYSGHHGAQKELPAPVADELRSKYGSDFKNVILSSRTNEFILSRGEKKLTKAGNFMEPAALSMFSLPLLQGDTSALNDPHSIVLSASLAKAFFGEADPLGQVLRLDDSLPVKVTGVYKDFAYNSAFSDVSFVAPWQLYNSFDGETKNNRLSWGDNNWHTFVQLADHSDIAAVSEKIKTLKAINDPWLDSAGRNQNHTELFLYPMNRWHLYSEFRNGDGDTGRIEYVRLFGLIGVLVLLLACINFMNLSTARSEKRAKEVGIRKTIGSLRRQLILQFFAESLLVTSLALLIALGLAQLTLPFFNGLAESKMTIPWGYPGWWIACIGFSVFTGIIAGSYPALYLSSFKPIKVLKGISRAGRLASLPRQVLVVLQFTVSIAMIIGTIIVFRQIQYAKDRPVGYDQKGLLTMEMHTPDIANHFAAFRTGLINSGAVTEVAESFSPVTASWPLNGGLNWTGHSQGEKDDPDFSMKSVSPEYAKAIGLEFTAGRDFRPAPSQVDSTSVILNESAVKYMKLKDPVGKMVVWQGTRYTVVGVVKNIVMESPYESPVPAIFNLAPAPMRNIIMRLNPQMNAPDLLSRIAPIFAKFSPAEPFDYKFIDQQYDAKFRTEMRIGQLAGFFTVLAIFISCLGLFGLATFIAEQRTKEIGVRKVLGANLFTLWKLLSQDFVLLIGISCLIAIPIAGLMLHQWLQQFVYKTQISGWIFVMAALGALVITLFTVSFQAIKAAMANPVKSLRTE